MEAIGHQFGLKVRGIELATEDYLEAAAKISCATSGTKPAAHWHTYIFTAKSGVTPNDRLLVGANGEFVRTYYLDKGIMALAADFLLPGIALREFWKRKAKPALKNEELCGVSSEAADSLCDRSAQVARLAGARPGGSPLRQLDHFYLEERVRHFVGNGLALYGLSAAWRTPFLSVPWIAEAEKLPRKWKLGNNWHRHAIARLCHKLLDFPEEHVAPAMAKTHPPLYWLPSRRQQQTVGYADYEKVFRDERILSLLLDHANDVSDLIDPGIIEKIVAEQRISGTRQRAVSILLALAVWRRSVLPGGKRPRDRDRGRPSC